MESKIKSIKFVREVREKHFEDIKNKDNNKIIEYFQKKAGNLNKELNIKDKVSV